MAAQLLTAPGAVHIHNETELDARRGARVGHNRGGARARGGHRGGDGAGRTDARRAHTGHIQAAHIAATLPGVGIRSRAQTRARAAAAGAGGAAAAAGRAAAARVHIGVLQDGRRRGIVAQHALQANAGIAVGGAARLLHRVHSRGDSLLQSGSHCPAARITD